LITNGPRLLLRPSRAWPSRIAPSSGTSSWLLAAGLTAVVIPALAVVGGHLGSAVLGHTGREVALQRAAVGLVATVGGALVMAPALTLALLSLARASRTEITPATASVAAMGLVWPIWAAGVILAVPPLLGLGPELGEAAWAFLAILVTVRTLRTATSEWLGVRRRWTAKFLAQTTVAVIVLFAAIPIAPALAVRAAMGVSSSPSPSPLEPVSLPLPPAPSW
jgi:hypothetical protein